MKKTEQLNIYLAMLSNPNLAPESRSLITELFNELAKELKKLQSADSSSSGDGCGDGGSGRGDGGSGCSGRCARTPVP